MEFLKAMAFVERFSHSGKPVRDLSRIRRLMEQLGNPQDRLKFVHIAGTNGKGSTAEYLTGILMAAGYRTATFTSPYIRRYTDRIRIDREEIGKHELCRLCQSLQTLAAPEEGYSQFEISFAVAMLYFVQKQVDIVVLETGMGGLLDCTNCIRDPLCCVLTTIDLDHQAVLGETLSVITAQKAGILKRGAQVVVSSANAPETIRAVSEHAQKVGAVMSCPGEPPELLTCGITGTTFRFRGETYETRMGGAHQAANAAAAIAAAQSLTEKSFAISAQALRLGIAQTAIPGRVQILSKDPPVILDGGHNPNGIDALKNTLLSAKNAPIIGIIGMTHAEAVPYAARVLPEVFDRVLCVDGFMPNAVPAAVLDEAFDATMGEAHCQRTRLADALRIAKAWARIHNAGIVVCGSLYLVSWFLHGEE